MTSLIHEPNTDFHLKLNEQLFHIPHELLRKNVKQVHKLIDKESLAVESLFHEMNKLLEENTLEQDKVALAKLNNIIKHVDAFEKKLNKRVDEELKLLDRIKTRITFFQDLENAKTSNDTSRLIEWYQKYTNLLIGDYLIRNSQVHSVTSDNDELSSSYLKDEKYWNPGVVFLKQQHLQSLLDYDILLAANRISKSLTECHDLNPLIAWIGENKTFLKRNYSILEFETRLQEYVELLKCGDYTKAIACFQNFLLQFMESNFADLKLASGLLVFIKSCQQNEMTKNEVIDPPIGTDDKTSSFQGLSSSTKSEDNIYKYFFHKRIYKMSDTTPSINKFKFKHYNNNMDFARYTNLLDEKRWSTLNQLFTKEYYSMYGISHQEPLLMYLSLGISTLKTKECLHDRESMNSECQKLDEYLDTGVLRNTCPVCTDEFAPIAKNLPYAHHIQSKLFENPVMLPNGNIYDAKKLKSLAATVTRDNLFPLKEFEVIDPIEKKVYSETEFITMYPT